MLTDFSRFTRVYLPGKTHTEFFFPAESTNPEKVDIFYTYIYERVTKNVSHLYFLSFPFLSFFCDKLQVGIVFTRSVAKIEMSSSLPWGAVQRGGVCLHKGCTWGRNSCRETAWKRAMREKKNLFFDGKIQKDSIASKFEAVVEDYKLSFDSVLAFSF